MPKEFSRSQRMAEQIRRDLSDIVRDELKDPRLGFLSFTAIKLSKDLGSAIIYCSVIEKDKVDITIETLNRAAGFLRSSLASRIHARTVPQLKFVNDESVERGSAMEALIQKAVNSNSSNDADSEED